MNLFGIACFALLSFLPGAWLAFGLRLPGAGRGARALLAVVLSPVVIVGQFYVARFLGISFSATTLALVVVNVPAVLLVARGWKGAERTVGVPGFLPWVLVWAVPVGLLLSYFYDPAMHALRAHSFVHADIVYGLANGWLRPEESQLAGVSLGYPWGGHVPIAVLSWLGDVPPQEVYPWSNLVLLLATGTLLALVCRRVGGGVRASVLTVVWVLFAVNAVGYALQEFFVPEELVIRYPVWGDASLHPWMRKYSLWNQHPYGQGFFAALLLVLAGPRDEAFSMSALVVAAVSLIGVAIMYPPLIPIAGLILVARWVHEVLGGSRESRVRAFTRLAPPLAAIGLLTVIVTLGTLALVGETRAEGTGVALSNAWQIKVKTVTILLTFGPLLAGSALLVFAGGAWKERRPFFLLGGLAGLALYWVFSIQDGVLDYKPLFASAMCLAPLASLGVDAFLGKGGWPRTTAYVAIVALLVGLGADRMLRVRIWEPLSLEVRLDEFALRLAEDHELEAPLRAIETDSPRRTVVVVDSLELHVPTFARRSIYAPPHTDSILLGVGMRNRQMLGRTRGYGDAILDERQGVTRELFRSPDPDGRLEALREIERLERPIAILLERDRHSELLGTLQASGSGRLLHDDGRWAVWLEESASGDQRESLSGSSSATSR